MSQYCPKCGTQLLIGGKFCPRCGANVEQQTMQPIFTPQPVTQSSTQPSINTTTQTQQYGASSLWYQNYYRIRKKTLTVGNKYWLEDQSGAILGFCKQKLFKLKEDIRIYTDENEGQELFSIKQEQIMDAWGKFAVIDSSTNTKLGYVKRNIISAFVKDTWEIYTTSDQLVGQVIESSTGRALARKFMPGGALVPEQMHLEMNGQILANINQEFKIIGDIWTMNCQMVPSNFDRRVLLACILLMGMIERRHK
jgi:uncharacterized protein YxjI